MKTQDKGFSLIEAMIAFIVLSIGLIASVKLMANMKVGTQVAQQRMQAMDYATNQIESMRAAGTCTAMAPTQQPAKTQDTAIYTVQVTCNGNLVTVTVTWNDSRNNQTQVNGANNQVIFDSQI